MQRHTITSEWLPADDTENRLEVAATDEDGLVAIRDSFDPDRQVFATLPQLGNFVRAAEQGKLKRIIGTPAR